MGSVIEETEMELVDFDDAVSVAPNWKLVWWRFKRHRLAFYSGFVIIMIIFIAAFPGFFSTQNPNESETRGSFIPPQGIHFWDNGPALFSYAMVGKRNPKTLKMGGSPTKMKKSSCAYLVKAMNGRYLDCSNPMFTCWP